MTQSEIKRLKTRLIREIKGIIAPNLRPSGYNVAVDRKKGILGGSRKWLIWAPKNSKGMYTRQDIDLRCIVLPPFEGLSEDGPVEEFGLGAVVIYYSTLPLEDLIKLKAWALKTFKTK